MCPLKNITEISALRKRKLVYFFFSDVKISRRNDKFVASVKRMPACNGIFVSYETFISTHQIKEIYFTIPHITLIICCSSKQYIRKLAI